MTDDTTDNISSLPNNSSSPASDQPCAHCGRSSNATYAQQTLEARAAVVSLAERLAAQQETHAAEIKRLREQLTMALSAERALTLRNLQWLNGCLTPSA